MLILAATLLALALVPLLDGRLGRLGELRLSHPELVAAALVCQVLAITVLPTWPRPFLVTLHGGSYLLAGLFVWANRRLPGLPLLALGGASNATVIALNDGTLPASRAAVEHAGLAVDPDHFVNSGVLAHPRLGFLGDVFASPSWFPVHNVYSLGDLLLLVGAVWAVHRTCRTVLARDPRPALAALAVAYQAAPERLDGPAPAVDRSWAPRAQPPPPLRLPFGTARSRDAGRRTRPLPAQPVRVAPGATTGGRHLAA